MGIFSDQKVEKIQKELEETKIRTNRLIEVTFHQQRQIENIEQTIHQLETQIVLSVTLNPTDINTALRSIIARLHQSSDQILNNVLQVAQNRRLALNFLTYSQITELFTTLQDNAFKTKTQLLITKPTTTTPK